MLQLRDKHDEAMRTYAVEQYVERTLAQFQQFFPRHCEINGEEPMREMIRLGVRRAKTHGIVAERNVVLYTTMMLLFGSYFDEDPLTPWARQVLADRKLANENDRAERLYDAGEEHWQTIAGDENRLFVQAIMRLRKLDVDEVAAQPEQRWPKWLRDVFPSRCEAVGPQGVAQVVRLAGRCASRHGLNGPRERAAVAALILMLGSRFYEDPMFPWASECLVGGENFDAQRGEQLTERGRAYADAWLAHVKETV